LSTCRADLFDAGSFFECTFGAGHDGPHRDEQRDCSWSDYELPDYTYEQGRIDERAQVVKSLRTYHAAMMHSIPATLAEKLAVGRAIDRLEY
jgi:hypothetical protein